jgi:hypothetical protein
MPRVTLRGKLLGVRKRAPTADPCGWVVLSMPSKPNELLAEAAFVYVEDCNHSGRLRARYVPWVNIFDIEHAGLVQGGCWSTVEPTENFLRKVEWLPYGWGGQPLPSVADIP